jgi:hypothetical protein
MIGRRNIRIKAQKGLIPKNMRTFPNKKDESLHPLA